MNDNVIIRVNNTNSTNNLLRNYNGEKGTLTHITARPPPGGKLLAPSKKGLPSRRKPARRCGNPPTIPGTHTDRIPVNRTFRKVHIGLTQQTGKLVFVGLLGERQKTL